MGFTETGIHFQTGEHVEIWGEQLAPRWNWSSVTCSMCLALRSISIRLFLDLKYNNW